MIVLTRSRVEDERGAEVQHVAVAPALRPLFPLAPSPSPIPSCRCRSGSLIPPAVRVADCNRSHKLRHNHAKRAAEGIRE